MKFWATLLCLIGSASMFWGQAPAPSVSCGKNVSFAVAESGQPVPAIPKFTLKWLGSKERRESFSGLCFSQVPSYGMPNYLLIFSTTADAFHGLQAAGHTYKTSTPAHESNAAVTSYGGTWTFAYTGVSAPAITDTLELRRDDKPKAVEVRAFDQSGRVISQASLSAFDSREKLLEKVLSDVLHDAAPAVPKKTAASSLPVYYVNCDVDNQNLVSPAIDPPPAAAPPAPAPQPAAVAAAPPPKPELEIWSSPPGADIFLDGAYVGQTPHSLEVSEGEHTVNLRKRNFAIWQRRIQANPGKRRIGGYLEQKVLNLQ